jgi:hypothetical protein
MDVDTLATQFVNECIEDAAADITAEREERCSTPPRPRLFRELPSQKLAWRKEKKQRSDAFRSDEEMVEV